MSTCIIKFLCWGGDAQTIIVYIFLKFTLHCTNSSKELVSTKNNLAFLNVPSNSFLANRFVRCLATAFICNSFLCELLVTYPDLVNGLSCFLRLLSYHPCGSCDIFTNGIGTKRIFKLSMRKSYFFNFECKPLLTHFVSATSKLSRSNTVIFVAGS